MAAYGGTLAYTCFHLIELFMIHLASKDFLIIEIAQNST